VRHLWLQLDEGDSDVAAFFHYLALAAETLGPRRNTLPTFTPDCLIALGGYSRRFFRALCAGTNPPEVIVLDDYHEVRPDSALHAALRDGLQELPQGVAVIIMSRSEPPAALARMLANGSLEVLHSDALTLNEDESRAIAARWGLSDRDIVLALHERTEGWAAGLVLLLASWRPGSRAQQQSGEEKVLFDYFAEEVLARADQDTRTVLVEMSLLPRVSGPMAVRLTGVTRAGEILADLSRRGYFVVRHDAPELTYQFHALFREFLLRRAGRTLLPERLAELRLLAASFLQEAGQVEDAFQLFLHAGAWAEASQILCSSAPSLLREGRSETVARWVLGIPEEVRRCNPWLLLWLGTAQSLADPCDARVHLGQAFELFRGAGDATGLSLTWATVADVFFFELEDFTPLDHWISTLEELHGLFPEVREPEVEARLVTAAFGALMHRQPWHPELHDWEERALQLALSPADPSLRLMASRVLGLYYGWWAMDLSRARLLLDALRPLSTGKQTEPVNAIFWQIADANYQLHLSRIGACQAAVDRGLAISAESGLRIWDSLLLALRCWAALSTGDLATAERTLEKMAGAGERAPRLGLCAYHYTVCIVSRHRGELGLACEHGRISVELAVAGGMPLAEASCRLAWALAEPPESVKAALEVALAQARRCRSRIVQAGSLLSLALTGMRRGEDGGRALAYIREGFAAARDLGVLHFVWFRPAELADCCALALEHGIETEYVRKLVRTHELVPSESAKKLEAWPWELRIEALGGFAVLRNGEPLRSGRKAQKKPLEMLRFLVAHGEEGMRQDLLAEALWPDSEGDTARFALGTTLCRLRKLLGKGEAIVQRDGRISLNSQVVLVDAWALERLLDQAEETDESQWPCGTSAALLDGLRTRVKRLYRGDLFGADADEPQLARARDTIRSRVRRLLGAP
jgi:hypothetical protein